MSDTSSQVSPIDPDKTTLESLHQQQHQPENDIETGIKEADTTQSQTSTDTHITDSEFGIQNIDIHVAPATKTLPRGDRPISIRRPTSLAQHLENLPINPSSSFRDGPTFEDLFPDLVKQKKDILYYSNPRNIFVKNSSLKSLKDIDTISQPRVEKTPKRKETVSFANVSVTPTSPAKNVNLGNTTATNTEPPESTTIAITKKYSNEDVKQNIDKIYKTNNPEKNNSSSLDILAIYIKGQKILYTEAKTYCEQQLNFLMLPAIFISCVSSIFSLISTNYPYGLLIIAGLNGFNSFLLALISYLKLDAKAQAHKSSAYKFDKLESMCQFNSGKFMFFDVDATRIIEVIISIENEVKEIKETNQFILPESIRHRYPMTYSTNIFAVVKKIQSIENICVDNLSSVLNKIEELKQERDKYNRGSIGHHDITNMIDMYEEKREEIMKQIFYYREQCFNLDQRFNDEIRYNIKKQNRWFITRFLCCDWLKT